MAIINKTTSSPEIPPALTSTYVRVVQGAKIIPNIGHIIELKVALHLAVSRIHQTILATRGPKRTKTVNKQHILKPSYYSEAQIAAVSINAPHSIAHTGCLSTDANESKGEFCVSPLQICFSMSGLSDPAIFHRPSDPVPRSHATYLVKERRLTTSMSM